MADINDISSYENVTFQSWFVQYVPIEDTLKNHASSFVHEFDLILGGIIALIHALKSGGRYPYLWLAIFLHGLVVECITYYVPDIDNFWHSHKLIMFLGGRLPLSITLLYPTFLYTAAVSASYLRLPRYIEPFAVGLLTVLMDIPYDILGIKFLFWTWHDTDPNIYDRFFWVPWTSFYFHATFATSVIFFNNFFRKIFLGKDRYDPDAASPWKECLVALFCGLLGMPGGVLQFMPLYHPLHDLLGIHSEMIVIFLLFTFALLVWSADRTPSSDKSFDSRGGSKNHLIGIFIIFRYTMYFLLAVLGDPESVVYTGLHEPTGPCDQMKPVQTPIGIVLSKRKYLCTSDYNENYDFHCLPGGKPPADFRSWYTVCGTPYPNRAEYIALIGFIGLFAMFVFYQLLYRSGTRLLDQPASKSQKLKTK